MANKSTQINCSGVVFGGDCVGVVAINGTPKVFDSSHNNKTYLNNSLVTPSTSILINAASGPPTLNGLYGLYYIDVTGGAMPIYLGNPAILKDCRITLKRIDATANNITLTAYGAELFEFAAMPQVILPVKGNSITITSNGTDWFKI